jgi:CBS domain-containing protein
MPNRLVSELIENQRVLTATSTITVADAAVKMRDAKVGAILVVGGGRLVGIFTERDALYRVLAAGKNPATTTLSEVMTTDPTALTPDRLFGHALHLMHERGFRHVPVVDSKGFPIGVVSSRDALGQELEQFNTELDEREHITEILG